MKSPVEHIRVSARAKEILIKFKRQIGLEHWNEICRFALCRSLANPTLPSPREKVADSTLEMDWKTFAGKYHQELSALIIIRAKKDGIDILNKNELYENFRNHLERGIMQLKNIKNINELV